ncbi:TPA: ATPase [Candidatus Bipolaricaulota bacterium]|nr:ATPase [Candidatus Bipolaricaulota bacterium]
MMQERREEIGAERKSPYREERKFPEPTVCPRCGLIYSSGIWHQAMGEHEPSKDANKELCPACRREVDRYPGGIVYLSGGYLLKNEGEIMNLVRNQEEQARAKRPLQRIMWVEWKDEGIEIATTNHHLARRIGRAINSAHAGRLVIKQKAGENFVRVYWEREE